MGATMVLCITVPDMFSNTDPCPSSFQEVLIGAHIGIMEKKMENCLGLGFRVWGVCWFRILGFWLKIES